MGFWGWFGVFAGIAVVGLVILTVLGLGLWRRAKVLLAEIARLSAVVGTLETALAGSRPGRGDPWDDTREDSTHDRQS